MSKSPSNASTQTINLAVAQKQTEKIALQPGQAIKIMVDGQPYTGQKTINGQAVRMVRKGDKLILEVEGQDQALVEVSGFFPAEAATEQAAAQDLLGTIDAQALFEAGSSAQLASAELGALPTVSTPSWGTLIAQASTGAISATSAATTTAATTAAVTTTTAAAAGAVSAGAIAAGAALVAAAAIANSNDNDAPADDDVADTVPPTLSITSDVSNLRTGETATITFTFSEDPGSSFTLADIVVTGGSLGEITGSGLTRTATFTPTPNLASGTASITVAAGTYTDAAGNAGGAGTTPAITFNTQSPTVQITSDVAAVKIGETAVITFTFSEDPGSTFTSEDVVVSGGTLGEITGSGLTRTATFTPAASTAAQASITVTSGSYANASGNTGAAGTTPTLSIDTVAPTLQISSNVAAVKVGETATITFTFSEDPGSTFTADDVAVTGGTLGAITGSGLTRTATFTPTPNLASGTASITVAGGTYTDAAGNTGGAGTTPTISIDTLAPTLQITSSAAALRAGETATITFTFSEDPGSSFTSADVTVTGGTLGEVTGSGLTRTATFTPSSGSTPGTASFTVAGGSYTDTAGNTGAQGALSGVITNTQSPSVLITSSVPAVKIGETAVITFTFSEDPGSTFTSEDVVVSGGTLGEITGSGLTRTATFTPAASTTTQASITVTGGSYANSLGQTGTAGTTPTLGIDTVAPTLQISSNVAAVKVGETATITFTFSEDPGSTFTADDVAVTGGTLGAITGSGLTRTATFTPTPNLASGTASITVAGGTYTDAAGNTGGAGTTPTISIDTLAPTITIDSTIEGDNIVSASEDNDVVVSGTTTGVEDGRTVTVTLTDGTTVVTQNATVTNNTWSLTGADISGLTSGDITVTANVTDLAGNPAVQANKTIALDNSVADLSGKSVQAVSNLIPSNTNMAGWGGWVNVAWGDNVTTAPDGTNTADSLTALNSGDDTYNIHDLRLGGVDPQTQYTYSVYAKADEQTSAAGLMFRFRPDQNNENNAPLAQFNLLTGQLVSHSGTSASIVSCGDGWYRLSMTFTSAQTIVTPVLETRVGLYDGRGDDGHSVFLWGPQLVQGAQALPFVASGSTAGDVFAVSSTAGANISASELAMGVPLTIDLTGATLAVGDTLSLVDASGRVYAEILEPTAGVNALVLNSASHSLHDGTHQLSVQITDAVGNTSQSQSLSVTVDTSAAETIGGLCTNDQIRAGGGNDTIHLSAGGNDTLIYRKEKSVAGWESQGGAGSGMDTVHDFSFTASGTDKLDLSGLLTGFQVAAGESNASVAERLYNGGYISLRQSGADLVLSVDHDGASGNTAQAADLITFKNRNLTDIDANGNVLQALEYLLDNDILVLAQDHLTVTGGSGRAGTFVQGDTVQLSWDGSAQGYNDPNVTSVKVSLFGQEVTLSQQNGVWTGSLALGANFAGTSAPVVELGLTGGATSTLYAQETVVANTQTITVASLSSVAVPTLVTNLLSIETDAAVAGFGETLNDNHAFTIDGTAQTVRMMSDGAYNGGWIAGADTGAPIAGKTFTFSAWLWGTGSVDFRLANGDYVDTVPTTVNLTSTPTRYSFTRTFSAFSGTNQVVLGWVAAIDGNDQFMISGAQLEAGANMSAYVARNGTAGTVLTGDGLNAEELATGFTMNVDLTGQTLAAGQAVQIVDQLGNVWGESSTLTAGAGGVVSVLVKQSLDNVVADGTYQLSSRLVNVQTGTVGTASTAALTVTVDTSAGETIGSFAGVNEVIRGGAGNDSIFLTTGGQDTVVFDVVADQEANATGGNGSDLITGFTFALGADKDAIVLDGLLLGYTTAVNLDNQASALAGFLDLVQSGSNLELRIDRDGEAGGVHGPSVLATFANTNLSDINGAASEWEALRYMLATSTLVVL